MIRKLFLPALAAMSLASLLAACGEEAKTDPYKTVTLREVTRGTVVSKRFKYKFIKPQVVALNRNLGLIRDGNILEFIAARSLEDKLKDKLDGYFELAVTKRFSPYVYFRVEQINTETDTVFTAQRGAIAYPTITTEEEYGTDTYEERDINKIPYNNTGTLKAIQEKKIKVADAKIVVEQAEGKKHYFLEGAKARFRVDPMSDGMGLIFKLLAEKGYHFKGGLMLTEIEDYSDRMKSKVAGTVEVQYVMYGDKLITG